MSETPSHPKIYHITHVDNLKPIVQAGRLFSDARMAANDSGCRIVGMSDIKRRRLEEIEVSCHPGTFVGEYVPFCFCPRSIMLYILHRGNHPNLTYRGGQEPIVHLQADFHTAVRWAESKSRRWAISDRNAGTYLAEFYNRPGDLDKFNWDAIASNDFREMKTKEGKQAEFLMHNSFPWELVESIGAIDSRWAKRVDDVLHSVSHRPAVRVERAWYF